MGAGHAGCSASVASATAVAAVKSQLLKCQ